jgi:hypothetical protein
MYFLNIYEDSGDKTTEIGIHEETVNKNLLDFTGPFVDFINQNEKAYNALADLGQNYDDDARLISITRRMQCKRETYGWILAHIEVHHLSYAGAMTFMRQQGIRQETAGAAYAFRQARIGHTDTAANNGSTDVDDNRHGLASIYTVLLNCGSFWRSKPSKTLPIAATHWHPVIRIAQMVVVLLVISIHVVTTPIMPLLVVTW